MMNEVKGSSLVVCVAVLLLLASSCVSKQSKRAVLERDYPECWVDENEELECPLPFPVKQRKVGR